MGEVIRYQPETWLAMKLVKSSLNFYEEERRPNDVYGTAKKKEKELLRYLMNDRVSA